MRPVVSELVREGYRVQFRNVRNNQNLAMEYGVRSVPTFVYIRDGEEVRRKTGYQSLDSLKAMWRPSWW